MIRSPSGVLSVENCWEVEEDEKILKASSGERQMIRRQRTSSAPPSRSGDSEVVASERSVLPSETPVPGSLAFGSRDEETFSLQTKTEGSYL